jgi:hypothetical protein
MFGSDFTETLCFPEIIVKMIFHWKLFSYSFFALRYDGNNEKEMSTRESTEKTRKYESKPISYSHGASPNVKFTILPRIDKECFPAFDRYLKCVENYEYDAYLIFTAEKFGKRHLFFARRVEEKPLFFIRTKVDSGHTEALNEEDVFYRDIRASLAKDLKTLKSVQCGKCEIYLVSNRQQEKWDFDKLMKAIAGSLSHAKKECFRKSISKIQEFIVEERFNNFIKGTVCMIGIYVFIYIIYLHI